MIGELLGPATHVTLIDTSASVLDLDVHVSEFGGKAGLLTTWCERALQADTSTDVAVDETRGSRCDEAPDRQRADHV